MNEAKLEKQKQNLVELGVMDPSDTLVNDYPGQASYVGTAGRTDGPLETGVGLLYGGAADRV